MPRLGDIAITYVYVHDHDCNIYLHMHIEACGHIHMVELK